MSKRCMGCMETFSDEFEICPYCGYVEGTPAEEAIHMQPGTMLADRYIVGKVLGFGGFGVTYIGWDGKLEQKVAIKEYLPSEFSTRMPGQSAVTVFNGDKSEQFNDGLKKFVGEAKRLAKFHNEPGIVKIFDSFTENETAYIVMEYLDGETLTARLKRDKTIPEDDAVAMLLPVMESLKIVHEEGILHRDIAPDNIFLTKSGEVKLIDFGASRYATTSHSRSLTVIIKPGYSPEEQYRSRGDQGPHTDVYAIAATLYKMITGKTPPDAMERHAKMEMQKKELLEEPHKLNKNISENRENAILNAMNVRIEDRTPDIQTFINELYSETPVKRRYGKIKKIDLYHWPLWLKILVPTLLATLIALGVLLATGVINFPSLFSDEVVVPEGIVIVPDVEGMDKDAALEAITKEKLLPSPEGNVESEFVEAGKIVLQTPMGGSYLEENGTVVLTVSSGKGVVEAKDGVSVVPYVIWDTQEKAIEKLKQAGMSEPKIETKSDDNVAAGQVISQSVESGEKVPEGTQITIVVSTGPNAFDMPNVVGESEETARSTLETKGVIVSVEYKKSNDVAQGNVISQSIKAGTKSKKGDKVNLVVASGKATFDVANVVGKSQDSAKSTLEGQGFKVAVLENYDNSVAKGNVISQNPGAGSSQLPGTTITIYVSRGKQPLTLTFNANGGTVSQSTKTVYYGESYGSLPTPKKDYYTFAYWTNASGTKITSSTIVSVTGNHTLTAQYSQNKEVGYVQDTGNNIPSDANITSVYWTYDETTTSSTAKLDGWGSYISKAITSYGSKQGPVYSDPSSGDRKVTSESYVSGYNKKTVTIYYRYYASDSLMYSAKAYGTYEGKTYPKENYQEFRSDQYNITPSGSFYHLNNVYGNWVWVYYSRQEQVDDTSSPINATRWYYQEPIYTYTYKRSQTSYSSTKPSGSNISNVKKFVKYIPR